MMNANKACGLESGRRIIETLSAKALSHFQKASTFRVSSKHWIGKYKGSALYRPAQAERLKNSHAEPLKKTAEFFPPFFVWRGESEMNFKVIPVFGFLKGCYL
jgi:hypothetical protein